MNIILLNGTHRSSGCISIGVGKLASLVAGVGLLLAAALVGLGYAIATPGAGVPDGVAELRRLMYEQRSALQDTRARAGDHLDALALRLGEMQARLLRLDALGERLVSMGKLDDGEFDFDSPPPVGGPESFTGKGEAADASTLVAEIEGLTQSLADRERQFDVLEALLRQRNLRAQILPAGRPVASGWISSPYGKRKDPFTGHDEHHDGIDFAGKKGSDVVAVAAGVVLWTGERSGYGQTVEIDHGDGYVTRYGHSEKILVQVGDAVERGQAIATMGSSGRSTGPHVHFEVLRNGKTVNPARYLQAAS